MSFATVSDYQYYYPADDHETTEIQQELDFASLLIHGIVKVEVVEKPKANLLNKLCVKICFYELHPDQKKDGEMVSETFEGYSYKVSQPQTSYYGVNEVDRLFNAYFSTISGKYKVNGGVL